MTNNEYDDNDDTIYPIDAPEDAYALFANDGRIFYDLGDLVMMHGGQARAALLMAQAKQDDYLYIANLQGQVDMMSKIQAEYDTFVILATLDATEDN
jgi:hypothetical protein